MPEGLTFAIAAVLAISAPLTGSIAFRRDRPPAAWFIFGALSGPLALAILLVAPPGRCPRCDAIVHGWPASCTSCGRRFGGASLVSLAQASAEVTGRSADEATGHEAPEPIGQPAATIGQPAGAEIRRPARATTRRAPFMPVTPAADRPLEFEPRRIDARRRRASEPWVLDVPAHSPSLVPLSGRLAEGPSSAGSERPTSSDRPSGSDRQAPSERPVGSERPGGETAPTGLWPRLVARAASDDPPVRVLSNRSAEGEPDTAPDGPSGAGLHMIASGIFTGGSVRLEIGLRYGIYRDGPNLVILGPVDRTPDHVQAVLPIAEIDLLSIADKVTVARSGGHDRLAMAFISAAGLRGKALEDALADVTAHATAETAGPAPR